MRLLCNDLVTNEIFVLYCDLTDTIEIVKKHFLIHQNLFLSPSDLTIDIFYLHGNPFPSIKDLSETDVAQHETTLEEYAIQEDDVLLFAYPIGA